MRILCCTLPAFVLVSCSGAEGGAATPLPSWSVHLRAQVTRSGEVDNIHLDGHYVVWAEGDGHSLPNSVQLLDLKTSRIQLLARADAGDEVAQAHVSGRYVIYTELHAAAPTDDRGITWRIFAVDLPTGQKRMVATSPTPGSIYDVPPAALSAPFMAWTQTEDGGHALHVSNLVTGDAWTATRQGNPGDVWIVGQTAVYDADSPGTTSGRDLFSLDLSHPGSTPTQLTHVGQVANPQAAEGFAVWQQPVTGDPTSLWALRLATPDAKPFAITSHANHGNAVVGDGFFAYLDGDENLVVVPLESSRGSARIVVPNTSDLSIVSRWAASGPLLAWVTGQRGSTLTIHVGQFG